METVVATVIADAVMDLQAGLKVYWPSEGKNEMPEAHAVGAVGRALGRAGFHVFHEVQCRTDGAVGHVDLVAISIERSAIFAIEGKRLYDGNGAEAMLRDLERLAVMRLASEHGFPEVSHHFRMLVTTTWQPNIQEWWLGNHDVPTRRRDPSWSALRTATAQAHLGGLKVQTDADWGEQWFLYALEERSTSFFVPRGAHPI